MESRMYRNRETHHTIQLFLAYLWILTFTSYSKGKIDDNLYFVDMLNNQVDPNYSPHSIFHISLASLFRTLSSPSMSLSIYSSFWVRLSPFRNLGRFLSTNFQENWNCLSKRGHLLYCWQILFWAWSRLYFSILWTVFSSMCCTYRKPYT